MNRLQQALSRWRVWWSYRAIDPLQVRLRSAVPSWSSLRTLGQSRIVGLTMLVPFLGTLIIFNQTVTEALQVPRDMLMALGFPAERMPEISLMRLKLTYFGLVLVGAASFFFALLCPQVVKRYPSAADYYRGDEPLFTDLRAENVAGDLAVDFEDRTRESEFGRGATFSYPDGLLRQFLVVFNSIGVLVAQEASEDDEKAGVTLAQIAFEEPRALVEGESEEDRELNRTLQERWRELHDLWDPYAGGIDVSKLIGLMLSGRRADRWYYTRTTQLAKDFKPDIMALEFAAADCLKPISRASIALLYLAGFSLLSVPTAATLWAVMQRTI